MSRHLTNVSWTNNGSIRKLLFNQKGSLEGAMNLFVARQRLNTSVDGEANFAWPPDTPKIDIV